MDKYALLEDLNSDAQNHKALKGREKVIKIGQCPPALIIVSKDFGTGEIFKNPGTSVHTEMRSGRCKNPSDKVNDLSIQFLMSVHTNQKDKSSSFYSHLAFH